MDQKHETRVTVQFEARVTNLRTPDRSDWGEVSDVSDYRACLKTQARLEAGDSLQLEMADSVLACQVVSSRVEGSQSQAIIEIQRIEARETELASLLEQTLRDSGPAPVETQVESDHTPDYEKA